MVFLLGFLLIFVALAILPTLWVRSVLDRHSAERPDFPGTGGQFARHLLDEMGLKTVDVQDTNSGDHYDPVKKVVALSPRIYDGRSLTAVVVAAHEVGHAMQDATGSVLLKTRTRLAKTAIIVERVGSIVLIAAPLGAALLRHPAGFFIEIAAGHSDSRRGRPPAFEHLAGGIRRQFQPGLAGAARRPIYSGARFPRGTQHFARGSLYLCRRCAYELDQHCPLAESFT